jgi:CheY-like chemotaxis protein
MENSNDKKKVLIVDDNPGLTTVLVDKLKVSGFDAMSASDGEDGLQKAFSFHPDIILLDMLMPKMDGLTMLGKLREDKWGKECKAVDYNVAGYIVKTDYTLSGVVDQIKLALGNGKFKS